MRYPTAKQKPQAAQVDSLPAPTGGLVSNRNLAMSRAPDLPPGAAVLENVFPTATGVGIRRGSIRKASVVSGAPIKSMFSYVSGTAQKLFAGTTTGIRDITTVVSPSTWAGPDVLTGKANGDWHVVQFSTAGGNFLVGVNGIDTAFLYNGTTFSATTITFPSGTTLTTADLAYVWVYKQRIWFIQKNSLNAWYLPVDQIGGQLTLWPMGGIFVRGGTLLWGQAWSLDGGASGGLSEQCVFCSTEGEVAAYQGLSPDVDQGWSKVGAYRIGKPMGRKGFIRAGGDIVIATTVGFISLAAASGQDYAALGQNAISYPIEDDWSRAVQERGDVDWRCQIWANGQMLLVAPPTPLGGTPIVFVANSNTGKWCKFIGWNVTAMTDFQGNLFFGSPDGAVRQGWIGGSDEGMPYVGKILPLFSSMNAPASLKVLKMARAVWRASYRGKAKVHGAADFVTSFPPPPNVNATSGGNEWEVGTWGNAQWDVERGSVISGDWTPIGGSGHDVSVGVQFTSGTAIPLDAELIRLDLTYTLARAGT